MSRRSVYANTNGVNPTAVSAPILLRPPASLEVMQAQLAELKTRRPPHSDIPALTKWALDKGRLEMWISSMTNTDGLWQPVQDGAA